MPLLGFAIDAKYLNGTHVNPCVARWPDAAHQQPDAANSGRLKVG